MQTVVAGEANFLLASPGEGRVQVLRQQVFPDFGRADVILERSRSRQGMLLWGRGHPGSGEGGHPGAQSHKVKVSIQKQISNINNRGDNVCLILTTSNFKMKVSFKSLKFSFEG